ncbi:MAG TPA: DUF459 domain-containing protein [Actinomycetota bacterium]|nr:DUF459 domain-containing protein [Actinomycetota bacterium]
MPAGRALTVVLVGLLAWTLLFGPELKRSAEEQPLGARRTVSIAVLSPFVWISDAVGLSAVTGGVGRALGRGGPEAPAFPVDDLPTYSPPPGVSPSPEPERVPVVDTAIRVPTGQDPLRVAVVGDSLAAGIGYYAERVFKPFFVDVTKQGTISTGLARPDYYNWPAAMKQIGDVFRPDIVIVMVGENDNQSLLDPAGRLETQIGTGAWPPAYEARVERFATIATRNGAHVIWLGLPIERDESRWLFIERQNAIYERVADRLPNVAYLDTWELFSKPDGGYTAYFRDGSRVELVREDDGVHFTGTGYTILMEHVARLATESFDLHEKTYET